MQRLSGGKTKGERQAEQEGSEHQDFIWFKLAGIHCVLNDLCHKLHSNMGSNNNTINSYYYIVK